jgi:hypothetical protein
MGREISIRTEIMAMRYGRISMFTFDLTWDQKRFCAWVAERAGSGVRRIHYGDVKAVLGLTSDRDITRLLKGIRERVDDVHEMVQFPIVNTSSPYFDVHMRAAFIWDDYCGAEQEVADQDFQAPSDEMGITNPSECGRTACAV